MATKLAVRASEAAELLSCDASTIRRYAQAGDLERIGSGRGTLYTMRSIESFLNGERGKTYYPPQKERRACLTRPSFTTCAVSWLRSSKI